MGEAPQFLEAIRRIDAVNAGDPRTEPIDGTDEPRELVYARRMSERLARFAPDASDALRLAARAQHIARWKIPRTDFSPDRAGYRQWRARLMQMHAEMASSILREVGYDEALSERVSGLIRKQGMKRDPEAQTLEDVVCLVFLEHYFADFALSHDDQKLVEILRKTLAKMSPLGREAALSIELDTRGAALVARALAG